MRWRLDDGQIEVVDEEVAEILRHKSPAERVSMIGEMHDLARELLRGRILTEHPNWSAEQVDREIARRLLGEANRTGAPSY